METKQEKRTVQKIQPLLSAHEKEIIESLGQRAFDLLTPKQVQAELGLKSGARVPDLVRQGWLTPAPHDLDIGPAHLYYRWRVEFVKRFKRPYGKTKN